MGTNILVVDDEQPIADLVEIYLKNENYNVYKFYNGKEALDCINNVHLDLAILDVMLPDIDGFTICQKIREKYLSISMDKALRLEELINEFFEITRFNLSHISLEFSSVNLSRMLEQIVYEFKPILDSNNLISSLQIEPNFEIKCDVNKMERVFDNLIHIAINYSVPGTTIEIIVTRELNSVSILFRNHGKTIPKEKLNRVFEQFYRLDSARVSKTGGAGLGLAIAKEIVEHHNGSIRACSENDMVEFIITLPLHL